MEPAIYISIASLTVAIIALPFSYFIATRQVRLGLKQQQIHVQKQACNLVADNLDEFYAVYNCAAQIVSKVDEEEIRINPKVLNPYLSEIDSFVLRTGIMDRLASAIDKLTESGVISAQSELRKVSGNLRSIRSQIALGADPSHHASLGIIAASHDCGIQQVLRNI